MGYAGPPNLLSRLRRSLWAAGGARAALAALFILGSALGVMRLVVNAPPLPAAASGKPAFPTDSVETADSAKTAETADSTGAADSAAKPVRRDGLGPGGRDAGKGAGGGI